MSGVSSRSNLDEDHVDTDALELVGVELPVVVEGGMPAQSVQRKPGTARGSPRRSRTAKASRINRCAAKSRCACERGGWGRLSDDGSGHYNPNSSEGPWGRRSIPPHGGAQSSPQARLRAVPYDVATRRTKDGRKPVGEQRMPGAGLSWATIRAGAV